MKKIIWFVSILLISVTTKAQTFANDCTNAIVICGNENIVSNATGIGNTQEIINGCGSSEHNTIWIKINIVQAGTLGFNLIPSDPDLNVDYDFWVFGANRDCGTTLGNPIRCNTVSPLPAPFGANLSSNVTGMNGSTLTTQSGPGPGSPGSTGYVRWLDVLPGQFYYIAIDRPGGEGGFELQWIGSAMAGAGAFPTSPTANNILDYEVCSSSPNLGIFDLDSVRTSINSDLSSNEITFYESYDLAFDEIEPLPNIINNTSNPQTIFAKVKNNTTECFSIISFNLVVNPIPQVTMSASNATICAGEEVTITFTGTPGGVVQYQINSAPLISATLASDGTYSFSQTISNTTIFSLNNIKTYDNLGSVICTQQYTSSITVTTIPVPTAIISYTAASFCANNANVQNVSLTGTNAFANGIFSALPTGLIINSNTGAITPSGSLPGDYEITYIIPASGGCVSSNVSTNVSILLLPTLTLSSAITSSNQVLCVNAPITPIQYTFGGNATGVSVSGLPAGVTYAINGNIVTISGTPTTTLAGVFNYTITATGNTCGAPNLSGTIEVTSGILPLFNQVVPVCQGATINLPTSSINSPPIVGVWNLVSTTANNVTYQFIPNAGQCALNTTMTIVVHPLPVVTPSVTAQSFCSGGTTNINFTSNVPGATFSWTATATTITGHSGSVTGSGATSINQTLVLNSNTLTPGQVTYVIVAEANGCLGAPVTVVVTVNPVPNVVVSPATQTICSGQATSISFSGAINNTVFTWNVLSSVGVSGALNGTGNAINQTLTTTGLSQGTVAYEITPSINGCTGTPQTVTVTVNPMPVAFGSATHHDLCSGESTFINVLTFNPLTTFNWIVEPFGVSGASAGTATGSSILIEQALSTTGTTQGYVDYIITPVLTACAGTPITVRVYLNPLPFVSLIDGTICVDAAGVPFQTYLLDSGLDNANYDFVWTFDGTAIPNATQATYSASEVGTYTVVATNSTTNCVSNIASAVVTATNPATSLTVAQSDYFSDNATLTVTVAGGNGSLLYQLDAGMLQESNVFTGVSGGPHTITVVDTQGCTYLTQEVLIIDYPRYFTPNGDGQNDTWNITGLNQPDAKLFIFDRYGKLIKQIVPSLNSEGWDGTYNNAVLPSTDYWFTLDYTENGDAKQFKAHFSLKR